MRQPVFVEGVSKTYQPGNVTALDEIDLAVEEGELFGLIGPDGAGKTTLFRILTTLIVPDRGKASVLDMDVVQDFRKIRPKVGYMPGRFSLYQDLTVEENLTFFATVYKSSITENYHLIKDIYDQLAPFKDRRAGKLSGGMKQKLALCCTLIHRPKVLFLDEPTTGVDAVSRREFWEMLQRLQHAGMTILVSTPYMDEASLCDRVALIQKGKILDVNTPEGLVKGFSGQLWSVRSREMYRLLKDLREFELTENCFAFGDAHHLTLNRHLAKADPILEFLKTRNHQDLKVETIEPGVEDCFMALLK